MNINKQSIRFGASILLVIIAVQSPGTAIARDTVQNYPIIDAMETATAKSFTDVKFYFGEQPHPAVKRLIGTYPTKRTTNAFGKSDAKACQWAFLSAITTLYKRALLEGGNAVVNIQSITTGKPINSSDEFVCRAGSLLAKVYLEGTVVSLELVDH